MIARLLMVPTALGLATCFTGHPDLPPPRVPVQPTVEEWPDAAAVVTDEVATLTYEVIQMGDRQRYAATLVHRLQVKFLSEAGLVHAQFKLPMDGFTSISRVVARSVDRFGNVEDMDPDVPVVVDRNEPGYDAPELKYFTFEVPGAEVGGVIDVLYTRVFTEALLVPPWVFGGPLRKLRSEYSVIFGPDIKIDHRFGRGADIVDVQPLRRELPGGKARLVFVEKDIPAMYPEPLEPHASWAAPWVATVIVDGRASNRKIKMQTWGDVAERVMISIQRVGDPEVFGPPEARFARIRNSIKGLSGLGLGILPPVSARFLLSGAPVCTRDAGALLFNAMKGSGAKIYPALLTGPTGPAVTEGFPSLYGFIRLVVAVDVRDEVARDPTCTEDPVSRGLLCSVPDDSYAFLDPLCRGCRYGELPTEYTGGRALVIMPDSDPVWVDIPEDPPERNRAMAQYRLVLEVDGSLGGSMNGELAGAPARALRLGLERAGEKASAAQRDAVVAEVLLGPKPALELYETVVNGLDQVEEPLTVDAMVRARAERLGQEKYRINPAAVFGPALPGRWRTARRTVAILQAPAWYETVASIELPVGYDVLEDPVAKLMTQFAEYASGFALRERTLNYSRRLVVNKHFVSPEDWPRAADFIQKVREIEENGIPVFLAENPEEPVADE